MYTGHGELVLRGGRRLPLHYEFVDSGGTSGVGRCGHLALDVSALDPAVFCDSMELHCDDGVKIILAVTSFSDRRASFVGRVFAPAV